MPSPLVSPARQRSSRAAHVQLGAAVPWPHFTHSSPRCNTAAHHPPAISLQALSLHTWLGTEAHNTCLLNDRDSSSATPSKHPEHPPEHQKEGTAPTSTVTSVVTGWDRDPGKEECPTYLRNRRKGKQGCGTQKRTGRPPCKLMPFLSQNRMEFLHEGKGKPFQVIDKVWGVESDCKLQRERYERVPKSDGETSGRDLIPS